MDRADITRSLVEPSAPSSSAEMATATQATAGGGQPAHIQRPDHTPGTVIALATSVYQPLATMLDIIGQTLGEAPLLRYDKGARPALVVDSGVSTAGERFCIALLFATFGGCDDVREIADPIRRWLIPARPAGGACDLWPPWANVPVHNLGREMEFVISLPVNVYHIGVQAWACEPYVHGGKELWVSRGVAEALSHLADCNADALCKEVRTCPEYWGMLEYFNVTKTWKPRGRRQAWGVALSYERPETEEEGDLHPAEGDDLHPAEEGDLHPADEGTFPASPASVLISLDSPATPHSRAPSGSRVPSGSSSRATSGSSSWASSGSSSRAPSGSRLPAYSSPLRSPEPRGLLLEDRGFALDDCVAHDVELGEIIEDEDDEDGVDILPTPFLVTPQKMEPAGSMLFDSSRPSDFPPTPFRAPTRASFSSPTKAAYSLTRTLYSPARDPYLPADVPQTPIRRNGRAVNFTDYEDYETADEPMTGNECKAPGGFIAPGGFRVTDGFMDHFMATDELVTPEGFTITQDFATTEDFATTDRFMTADNLATTPATPSLLARISTARTPKRRARNRRRNDNAKERRNDNANERRNDSNANTIPLTPGKGMSNPNGIALTPRKPLAPKPYAPFTPQTPHTPFTPHTGFTPSTPKSSHTHTPFKAPQLPSRGQRAFQPYPQFSPSKAYQKSSPSKAYSQSSPSKAAGWSLLDRLAIPPLKDRAPVPLNDRLAIERKLADRISGAVEPSDD